MLQLLQTGIEVKKDGEALIPPLYFLLQDQIRMIVITRTLAFLTGEAEEIQAAVTAEEEGEGEINRSKAVTERLSFF